MLLRGLLLVGGSPYRKVFRNGATLFPRMLLFVQRKSVGLLGVDPSVPLVESRRTPQEKKPWKELTGIEGFVEAAFLRPVLLGECIAPYRILYELEAVIRVDGAGVVLDSNDAANHGFVGLPRWLKQAEDVWLRYRPTRKLSFSELNDYYGQLTSQFPISGFRVAYAASGTIPCATLVRNARAVIEHSLYWAAFPTAVQCNFLVAILNSETARERVAALQARGQWGARHFDKVMFTLPIPLFDPNNALHRELAEAAEEAERIAATVALPEAVKFQRARKLVRDALADAGIAQRIDALVARLLDGD